MAALFSARRGPAVAFAILASIVGLLFSVVLGAWLSIGAGNPATRAINALADDAAFRDQAATFFVDKLTEDSGGDADTVLTRNEAAVTAALSDLIGSPEFTRELDSISDSARRWFVDGDRASASISLKPVVAQMVDTLEGVDPEFGVLRIGIATLDDLDLAGDGGNSPQFGGILTAMLGAVVGLFLVAAACAFGYVRTARSAAGAASTSGGILLGIGVLMTGTWFAATTAASTAASSQDEAVARTAIPIVASALASPFRTVGILWIALGAAGLVAGAVLRRRPAA
jgi:hypothetical protein